jgi:two-component sensor histidine kinase
MNTRTTPRTTQLAPAITFESLENLPNAHYEIELTNLRSTEVKLREALERENALIREKDELIRNQDLLGRESDHRLLNDLQMIVSMLSLQSKTTESDEVAAELTVAANRVATIERVHRRLHCLDGLHVVAFTQFLKDFCSDFSTMLAGHQPLEREIQVEGIELNLQTVTAVPLGFIVNELMTNAAKHGNGLIAVRLEAIPQTGYSLSVFNEGPPLPEGFNPAASKGLGMRIVRSFVEKISGELRIARGTENGGATFTVIFS